MVECNNQDSSKHYQQSICITTPSKATNNTHCLPPNIQRSSELQLSGNTTFQPARGAHQSEAVPALTPLVIC